MGQRHKLKLINIFTEDAKIKSEWRDDALPDTGSGKVKAIWEHGFRACGGNHHDFIRVTYWITHMPK
jgi:hypothetical protein